MQVPERWECAIWRQVLPALVEAGKTRSSYYVMAQEAMRLCTRRSCCGR